MDLSFIFARFPPKYILVCMSQVYKPDWVTHQSKCMEASSDSATQIIPYIHWMCILTANVSLLAVEVIATHLPGIDIVDKKIKIWAIAPIVNEQEENNPNCPRLLAVLPNHEGNVLTVRWSSKGLLASGSDDFCVIVWEKRNTTGPTHAFGSSEKTTESWGAKLVLRGHSAGGIDTLGEVDSPHRRE